MTDDEPDDFDLDDITPGNPLRAYAVRDPGVFEAAKKAGRKAKREPIPPSAKIPLEMAIAIGDPLLTTLAICIWQDYRSIGEPFDTPQELFKECGVIKQQKARALRKLEQLGIVIAVKRRSGDQRGNLLAFTERWRKVLVYKRKYRHSRRSHIGDLTSSK
jgi:hypothetical protein